MDPQALIQDYLDGELNEQQFEALSDWLAQSEANREAFVRAAGFDTQLHRHLANADLHQFLEDVDIHAIQDVIERSHAEQSSTLLSIAEADEAPARQDVTVRKAATVLSHAGGEIAGRILRQHGKAIGIAAAVVITAVVGVLFLMSGPDETTPQVTIIEDAPPITYAYVTGSHQAKWSGDAFELRDAMTQGSYELTTGSVQIEMVSGAKTLIQAPARFTLNGSNQLALHTGTLDAQVPRRAIGFTVETPDARIVDIGTEFHVAVDGQADTQIAVHDGQVLASASESLDELPPTALTAGQAVVVGDDAQLREADYVSGSFDRAVVASRYMPKTTGGEIVFDSEVPDDFRRGKQVSDKLQVYLEQSNVLLQDAVAVNLHPGQGKTIDPGQRVDVYLLHMDKTGIDAKDLLRTLDFGRPILGVATKHQQLESSDTIGDPTGQRLFENAPDSEGELLRGIESGDRARLMPDGSSMQLKMIVTHRADQVRVFVQSLDQTDE